ncbi:nitroreductase family protein [Microbacterium sediminicola]|uniref:Nitroreductase family protein n=1 Tax=Microbacterium sediminicola TaxID=415210 RepID=A0ABN2IBN0_9MICO
MSTTTGTTAIHEILATRYSTRVFDADAPIDDTALNNALEAARWAPSAANSQPWHAIVARRGSDAFARIAATLKGFNSTWAADAGALVIFVAETERDGVALPWAAYDTGQAAAHFTIQANADGLATHQMGGFEAAALANEFDLPATMQPLTVVAIGAFGDVDAASDELQQREATPRTRRPLADAVLVYA